MPENPDVDETTEVIPKKRFEVTVARKYAVYAHGSEEAAKRATDWAKGGLDIAIDVLSVTEAPEIDARLVNDYAPPRETRLGGVSK
jgi:hypothetical protein